ncbi:heavy metal translocating P-type ATPase [Candidatus Uhrbacteria bacterium]|nr:heavy metal translocating P-type ATPase [Candidatus Uhrbacteria bacterium]
MDSLILFALLLWTSPFVWRFGKDFFKGHFGIDIIALIAIFSSIGLQQYATAAVILFMLSGGEWLENHALRRAKNELHKLLKKAPTTAHLKTKTGFQDIPANDIRIGDILIIKPNEIIPVDGIILRGSGLIDESSITGESLPIERNIHDLVRSGSINLERVLELQAHKTSKESTYSRIIFLVRQATESKAPIVRLADRYSVRFTIITCIMAAIAWFVSHDWIRVLSVFVVATPCPLIIATPIAVMSAISKAASRGIIVKNGGALETLARVKTMVFDKTGTITFGEPHISNIYAADGDTNRVLQLAASLDQLSTHILAKSVVAEADKRKITRVLPTQFHEDVAFGAHGIIENKNVIFGKKSFLEKFGIIIPVNIQSQIEQAKNNGEKSVLLAAENAVIGYVTFADVIRPQAKNIFKLLQAYGVHSLVLLSGDRQEIANRIAKEAGITQAIGDVLPEQKLAEIHHRQQRLPPVAMVGDGVNDAPALAAADIGIAMAAHGASIASESADMIITVDNISRIGEAMKISKRMLAIATQGIIFGMGSSLLLMIIAINGHINPFYGAIMQEVIDVIVILNALRVRTSN